MARVAGTLETMELPRSPPKTVPPARAAVLLTQGLLQGPVLGGMRPLPARSLHKEGHPISKGLFAERPPGLKGQQPEPQPASCHQGPCCFADNKPWDKLRLERETQSKPENLPGLPKLLETQLPVESWSLWASQWALLRLERGPEVRKAGGAVLSVPQFVLINLQELKREFHKEG